MEVIKGPEAGKRGKVLEILRHVNRVRVEGVNIVSQDPHTPHRAAQTSCIMSHGLLGWGQIPSLHCSILLRPFTRTVLTIALRDAQRRKAIKSQTSGRPGRYIFYPMAIHYSNVQLICPETK